MLPLRLWRLKQSQASARERFRASKQASKLGKQCMGRRARWISYRRCQRAHKLRRPRLLGSWPCRHHWICMIEQYNIRVIACKLSRHLHIKYFPAACYKLSRTRFMKQCRQWQRPRSSCHHVIMKKALMQYSTTHPTRGNPAFAVAFLTIRL